jgi:hypothetical protein
MQEKARHVPARSGIRILVELIQRYPLAVGATVQAEIVIDRRPFWRLLFFKAVSRN